LWETCTGANFTGRCVQLQPGQYRNVNTLLNDDIASAREITFGASVPAAAVVVGAAPAPVIVAAAPAPVIVATRDPRIVLFQERAFGGSSVELTKTMGGLDRSAEYSGADAAVVYGGVWRLCSRQYFRGECADFAPGQYADLGALTGHVASAELAAVTSNATVSTVAAPVVAGQVLLYDLPNFRGQSVAIDGGAVRDLHLVGFDDRAASMRIVSGTWVVCTDSDSAENADRWVRENTRACLATSIAGSLRYAA
jgi:Beta/Gamma crystallin